MIQGVINVNSDVVHGKGGQSDATAERANYVKFATGMVPLVDAPGLLLLLLLLPSVSLLFSERATTSGTEVGCMPVTNGLDVCSFAHSMCKIPVDNLWRLLITAMPGGECSLPGKAQH